MLHLLHILFNPETRKSKNYSTTVALAFTFFMMLVSFVSFLYDKHLKDNSQRYGATVTLLTPMSNGDTKVVFIYADPAGVIQTADTEMGPADLREGPVVVGAKFNVLYNPVRRPDPWVRDTFKDAYGRTVGFFRGVIIGVITVIIVIVVRLSSKQPIF